MRISNCHYLIIDLEATCSDTGEVPRGEMEIIEIGAVVMDSKTFEIESEFQSFIRPVRHPVLTGFCTELTGIKQDQVVVAPAFTAIIAKMKQWMNQFEDSLFCSWGDYDRLQFMQDCGYHEIEYPFAASHVNLKAEFSRHFGLKKKLGISAALRHLGLQFDGSPHRGIDDAKNIARIVRRAMINAS